MIYIFLRGRIGNQLFMYAIAEELRFRRNCNEEIVIDDTEVLNANWENSLEKYNLNNVRYVHNHDEVNKFKFKNLIRNFYYKYIFNKDYIKKYNLEKKYQRLFNKFGLILCENGYIDYKLPKNKNILIEGYFQSEKYFPNTKDLLKKYFSINEDVKQSNYPNIDLLKSRNSVCISIKVEHNVGSSLYDVCSNGYWKAAIKYITDNVENPLFFICSDNVDYVKNNLIDCSKYDAVFQEKTFPVTTSLAVMGLCKHFIIGNTSFGWWAQYLSTNKNKIVVAPSKWMKVDMPIDIYQDDWKLIEV